MVSKVIRDYMEGGAGKLTVPGFGTFMRRGKGEIVFVDLLRGDDPTLSQLVEDAGGYSELEAMALIDRFIFRTKSAIERQGSATIEGFGSMTIDSKGIYQFTHTPARAKKTSETAVQEKIVFGDTIPTSRPAPRPASTHAAAPRSGPAIKKTTPRAAKTPARKKNAAPPIDWLLVVAMSAAVIAIVAMYFGLSRGNLPFLMR